MMMTMIKKIFYILLIVFPGLILQAQEKDFGIWGELNIQHDIVKKLEAEYSFSVRSFQNAGRIEQTFGEAGLRYKFNKYVSVAGAYRISSTYEDDLKYHTRHKLFGDLKGSLPAGDLDLSLRIRFQQTTRTYVNDPEDKLSRQYLRLKLKAAYDIPKFKFNPFISFEPFIPLSTGRGFEMSKHRTSAGFEVKVTKNGGIETAWIREHDTRPDLIYTNVIALTYSIKF